MASKGVPRFLVFARKLTLVSGLAIPLAGCADRAGSNSDAAAVVDSSDSAMPHPGVTPVPQDAVNDSEVQSPPEVAVEVATEVAEEVARCVPFTGIVIYADAGGDGSIPAPGVRPAPLDAGNDGCKGGFVPVGGPLAPPEFLA